MSEKKFTPGPWQWTDGGYVVLESMTPQANRFSKTGFILPDVLRADYEPVGYEGCAPIVHIDNDADANLIEAAPDMYEALDQQLAQWKLISNMVGEDLYVGALIEESIEMIDEVLRKARGEE